MGGWLFVPGQDEIDFRIVVGAPIIHFYVTLPIREISAYFIHQPLLKKLSGYL